MKKTLLLLAIASAIAGCATPANTDQSQAVHVGYAQACVAYGAAFAGALQLRRAGKMNQAQVDQITLIDSQITPICTGPLPVDATAATQQITAAVTALTILETVK